MNRAKMHVFLMLALAALLLAFPLIAFADDISNNLDASIDAVAEVMPLNVGGANGTTQLYVTPRNGDGKNGCNLTGSTTLVVSVSSSDTSVATVSPSSVTFTSCGDTPTLTVTPHNQGSATISVSQTSNNTEGTFNLAPATFTVNVAPPPNTPPQVSIKGVAGGESYEIGSVPAATCEVTDAEDGNSSFAATLSAVSGPLADYGLGEQTASCSYTDFGGLFASASVTYGIVDTTNPEISCAAPDGEWHASDVSIACTASDNVALANSNDASFELSTDVPNATETTNASTGTHKVCDVASNCATAGPVSGFKIDKKAPDVQCDAADGLWHATDQSVTCTATDGGSGPASQIINLSTSVAAGTETDGAYTASQSVSDAVGNSATAGPVGPFKIDKKAPAVSCTVPDQTVWHDNNVTVTCTSTDGGSQLANAADASFSLSTNVTAGDETDSASTGSKQVCDNVSNCIASGPFTFKVDMKVPEVSCGVADTDWHADDQSVTCIATDGGSGPASQTVTLTTNIASGTETSNASTGSQSVCDAVNNCATAGPVSGFKIDKKAPTNITFVGGPADGGTYYFGFVPAAPTCTAEDGGSGLDSCEVTGYSTAVGSHTLTATARDNVGNKDTAELSYTVSAWTLKGFYQPVDMSTPTTKIFNTVKNGSTVPLKFELFAGPTELSDIANVKSLTYAQIACDATAVTDEIETTATGGTILRYDTTAGQFVYNWKTPSTAGKCYRVTLTALDLSTIVAYFKLK